MIKLYPIQRLRVTGANLLMLVCMTFSVTCLRSQTDNPERLHVTNAIIDYFAADRENIHVQPLKTVFFTTEKVWFSGYIYSRQQQNLAVNTNNVLISLYDSKGIPVATKLCFAQNGKFTGSVDLSIEFPSGVYYLRAYTNWMNNFKEDESTTIKIFLINSLSPSMPDFTTPNPATLAVKLHPEGGRLVAGIPNVIGINIADCNDNPFLITEGELVDAEGNFIRNISTNAEGNGRFTIVPVSGQKTFIKIEKSAASVLIPVTDASPIGVAVTLDNSSPDFVNLSFQTNAFSAAQYAGRPLTFIIQKDNRAHFFNLTFSKDKLIQEFSIQPDFLFAGTNTLRLFDPDELQIAERIFYRADLNRQNPNLTAQATTGNTNITAGNLHAGSSISVTIVPATSRVMLQQSTITTALHIDPFLLHPIRNPELYFSGDPKKFAKNFDLVMLQQRSKYKWEDIISGPNPITYTFDRGLTVKGKLINPSKNIKDYRVRLFSLQSGINETVGMNTNNEFIFENLVLPDSASVNITLEKLSDGKPVKFVGNWQVLNTAKKPVKPLSGIPTCIFPDTNLAIPIRVGGETVGEVLEPVHVEYDPNREFNHKHKPVNLLLKAHKIKAQNNSATVLDFIEDNGFNVNRLVTYKMIGVQIVGKNITTFNATPSSPVIYVDDTKLLTNSILWNIRMEDIDEIYINSSAVVNSLDNNIGIIRIYLRHDKRDTAKTDSHAHTLTITDGFQRTGDFSTPVYSSREQADYYGILSWKATMPVNDSGKTVIEIADPLPEMVTVRVEGVDPSGSLVCFVNDLSISP